jgi:hypothetical protein
MGQKVAVVVAAKFLNQGNPHLPVSFEFLNFKRVDDVAKITGDHSMLPIITVKGFIRLH